jgi:hypothetical protein
MKYKTYDVLMKIVEDYEEDIITAISKNGHLIIRFKDFMIEAHGLNDKHYNIITTLNSGIEFSKIGLLNLYPYVDIKFEIESVKKLKLTNVHSK